MQADAKDRWAIVLAAGDGTRLRPLVRLLHGDERPKQFATITGRRSLLQITMDRVAQVAPPSRTVVIVSRDYARLAHEQLAEIAGVHVIEQPQNLGTAPGILLPLAHVRARAPHAEVAVFPSDHHVPRPRLFVDAVRAGFEAGAVTLVGVAPEHADPQLGWIVPGERGSARSHRVARFVEKPPVRLARQLMRRRALWNCFVTVGAAESLWRLAAEHLPDHARALERVGAQTHRSARVEAAYRGLAPADFSRAVLERATGLHVVRAERTGWADWGTPERIVDSLRGTSELEPLLRRLLDAQRSHRPSPALQAA